jgi:hypothetical protein
MKPWQRILRRGGRRCAAECAQDRPHAWDTQRVSEDPKGKTGNEPGQEYRVLL